MSISTNEQLTSYYEGASSALFGIGIGAFVAAGLFRLARKYFADPNDE